MFSIGRFICRWNKSKISIFLDAVLLHLICFPRIHRLLINSKHNTLCWSLPNSQLPDESIQCYELGSYFAGFLLASHVLAGHQELCRVYSGMGCIRSKFAFLSRLFSKYRMTPKWVDFFKEHCRRVIGLRIKLNIRKKCLLSVVLMTLQVLIFVQTYTTFDGDTTWHILLLFPHVILLNYLYILYVYFMVKAFSTVCKILQQRVLEEDWGKKEAGPMLQEYRLLWLQLKKLSSGLFSVFYRVCLLSIVGWLLLMIMALYGASSGLLQSGVSFRRGILLVPLTFTMASAYFTAERSQTLQNTVS